MLTPVDWLTCRHESSHAATAALLFWEVTSVERGRDGHGLTRIVPRCDGDLKTRGVESGMILLSAILTQPSGAAEDFQKLGALGDAGIPLAIVWARTKALLSTDAWLDLYSRISDELWRSPILTAADLESIFGVASDVPAPASLQGDVRGTASVVPPGAAPA